MIGDPKAVTHFEINLAGLNLLLTSSSHYLPTLSSFQSQQLPLPPLLLASSKLDKERDPPPPPVLPCLCAICASIDADISLPMYSKNALPEVPQKLEIRVSMHDSLVRMVSIQELDNCVEMLNSHAQDGGYLEQLFDLSRVDFTYSSLSHGDGSAGSQDTASMQLDIDEVSATLSNQFISKCLFMYQSWRDVETPPSSLQVQYPPPHASNPTHCVRLALHDLRMGQSTGNQFVARSLVLGKVGGAIIVRDCNGGKRIPFLYGPFDTGRWNSTGVYQRPDLSPQGVDDFKGNLIELLVTVPSDAIKGTIMLDTAIKL